LATQVAQTSFDIFIRDEVQKRALERNLEVIREAAKKILQETREQLSEIE
jgi:uncharacterized protein with HEPN domain